MMPWYAAHLIMYVKFKKHRQNRYPLWENIVLIKASSEEKAFEKAEKRGRNHEGDSRGSFRWGGKPARWIFAGVRQLLKCQDWEKRPNDGTEVTYLQLEVISKRMLKKMMEGKTVSVELESLWRESSEG